MRKYGNIQTHQYKRMRAVIMGIRQSKAMVGIGKMMVKNTIITTAPMAIPMIVSI